LARGAEEKQLSESDWIRQLRHTRPEVTIPGFWKGVEENCRIWAEHVSIGPYWSAASNHLSRWKTEYSNMKADSLLPEPMLPKFQGKGETRIRTKLHQCCVDDDAFQAFPTDGPPIPSLNDLVRTRVSCKYLDGVDFLADKLQELAEEIGICLHRSREGRVGGYFAQHIYFTEDVYWRFGGETQPCTIRCEIQLATQLSTRIWEATHPFYETEREELEGTLDWQWKPTDPRFVAHQLGHMIHLADGLLVQLRESVGPRSKSRG
jgi:hypothetical protein